MKAAEHEQAKTTERCACGGRAGPTGECDACRAKRQALQRRGLAPPPAMVPTVVYDVLRGGGRSLDDSLRAHFDARFGHAFDRVRIHTDERAAVAARSVNAAAFTVGDHIVFGAGRYAPETGAGRELLAHELAHTLQQHAGSRPENLVIAESDSAEAEARNAASAVARSEQLAAISAQPVQVARQQADAEPGLSARAKGKFYDTLIAGLRGAQGATISSLRAAASHLPASIVDSVNTFIDVVEFITDLHISTVLALISLQVGVATGLADMIVGLFKLTAGAITGVALAISGVVTGDYGPVQLWFGELVAAIVGLPAAFMRLIDQWWTEFNSSSTDRQTIMIGELFGQIVALLIPFAWAGRAGTAGRVARAGSVGEAGTTSGRLLGAGSEVADLSAFRAARAARLGEAGAGTSEGTSLVPRGTNLALQPKFAPRPVEVPRPFPRPVEVPVEPPLPAPIPLPVPKAPPVVAGPSKAAKVAATTAVVAGTQAQKIASKGKKPKPDPDEDDECNEPCPRSVPVRWPTEFLPEPPDFDDRAIRKPSSAHEWEGTGRGPVQRRFHERIVDAFEREPPPNPCFAGDTDPNWRYDAHHIHPLYLGGQDVEYNLCSLAFHRHQTGHRQLNNQNEFIDDYADCGLCSGYLTEHPEGQTYYLVEL